MQPKRTEIIHGRQLRTATVSASKALAASFLLAAVVPLAQAQNLDADPLYGSSLVQSGTTADPLLIEVTAGGKNSASPLGDNCVGYINFNQPSYSFDYEAGTNMLGVFIDSEVDTTIAINGPRGNWHCNDDSIYLGGTNGGVLFNTPVNGTYKIWVGTYSSGSVEDDVTLVVTEAATNRWASLLPGRAPGSNIPSIIDGEINFGDDSSMWANDGECDDPRFTGDGMAFSASETDMFKDATDCRSLFESGSLTLLAGLGSADSSRSSIFQGDVDFGDDSSVWANDGECDDPRFTGDGMAASTMETDRLSDATDCRTLYEQGSIHLAGIFASVGDATDPAAVAPATLTADDINFGDDSGDWSNDGECDDPRFQGDNMSSILLEEDRYADASDCRRLFHLGAIRLGAGNSPQ